MKNKKLTDDMAIINQSKKEQVVLSEEASQKLAKWLEQINAKKTVQVSKRSFLSWYIEQAPDLLSSSEVNAAIDKFYDTAAHLRQLLREVQKSKQNGRTDSIELVVKQKKADVKRTAIETGEAETLELLKAEFQDRRKEHLEGAQ